MRPRTEHHLIIIGLCILAMGGRALAQGTTPRAVESAEAARSVGKNVYDKWCSDCHSTLTGPGSMALQRKYHGDPPAILKQRRDLTSDYIGQAVRHGVSFMPSFRKTEISDTELALLAAYLASPAAPPSQPTTQP